MPYDSNRNPFALTQTFYPGLAYADGFYNQLYPLTSFPISLTITALATAMDGTIEPHIPDDENN